jgi:hypothetical protein
MRYGFFDCFLTILFPLARGEDPSLSDWNGRHYSVLAWPYNYARFGRRPLRYRTKSSIIAG